MFLKKFPQHGEKKDEKLNNLFIPAILNFCYMMTFWMIIIFIPIHLKNIGFTDL